MDKNNKELLNLLAQERAALLRGDFDTLSQLSDKKAACFERLGDGGLPMPVLARIKRYVDHNQTLLAAAINGVKAGRKRLAEITEVRENLSTYDGQGQRTAVNRPPARLTKSA